MNIDKLIAYIQNPESIPENASAELKMILDEYPFFQTGHLLYIKNLHLYKSLRYTDQLKIAATYSGDRNKLFDLIKGRKSSIQQEYSKTEHKVEEVKIEQNKDPEIEYNQQEHEFVDSESREEIVEISQKSFSEPEPVVSEIVDEDTEQTETVTEQENIEEVEIIENIQITEAHTREELTEIINHRLEEIEEEHIIEEISENVDIIADTQSVESDTPETDMFDFDFSMEEGADIVNESLIPDKKSKPSHDLQPQFIDYMYNYNDEKSLDESIDFIPVNETQKQNFDLINKFLDAKPKIKPKKISNEDEIVDISVESVQEKEFMSETLAKIYITQKKYDSAIKIYQKLSLKYPQKNTYFAEQIENIKKLSNN